MKNTENQLFNGSIPMQIGDEEYKASMLTDRDYADLEQYIKSKYVDSIRKTIEDMDDEDRKEILAVALAESISIGWGTKEGNNIIWSNDGLIHIGYQMILKRHPNVPFSQFENRAKGSLRRPKTALPNEEERKKIFGESLMSIIKVWNMFYPATEDKEEDAGGSSTESEKSDEGGHVSGDK